ncbi:MAG: COP23 domain-containing protein [Pleurocapsa sp. MO_192.B19]|nr:COP23 domain-containing protein [Pleurocapsa sp. MO_192.B19]
MKFNLLVQTILGLGMVVGAISVSGESSYAQERFYCDSNQMATTVQTERGSIPLIRWTDRSFPPPFTPEQRCQIVSDRFKKFDNNGTLKYIKADTINNLPALCVAAYKGGPCLPNGLLVTFKPGTDANQTLLKILDRRVWATSGPIQLSSQNNHAEALISEVDGETYVNLEILLNSSVQTQP